MTFAHGERAGSWLQEHGDPIDRMLAAQSHDARMPIATNDPKIKGSESNRLVTKRPAFDTEPLETLLARRFSAALTHGD